MPHFVFRINNHREYRCLERFEAYRQAREAVRELRRQDPPSTRIDFRLVFADDAAHAESLLRAPRQRTPSEDD